MVCLSIEKSLAEAWRIANQSKSVLWGGIGLIFLMLFPFMLYQFIISGDQSSSDTNLYNHKVFYIIYFFIISILFASYARIGIFLGLNLPVQTSSICKNLFTFNFLKIVFIYILELVIAILMIRIISFFLRDQSLKHCIALISIFILFYLSARIYLVIPILYVRKEGLWTAIKHSFMLTNRNGFKIIVIKIFALCIFVASYIPFGVPLIWVVPFINLLRSSAYKQLETESLNSNS